MIDPIVRRGLSEVGSGWYRYKHGSSVIVDISAKEVLRIVNEYEKERDAVRLSNIRSGGILLIISFLCGFTEPVSVKRKTALIVRYLRRRHNLKLRYRAICQYCDYEGVNYRGYLLGHTVIQPQKENFLSSVRYSDRTLTICPGSYKKVRS